MSGEENVVLEIGAFSTPTSWLLDNDAIIGQDIIQRLRGNGRRQSPTRTAFVSRRAFLLAIPTRRPGYTRCSTSCTRINSSRAADFRAHSVPLATAQGKEPVLKLVIKWKETRYYRYYKGHCRGSPADG